MQYEVNLYLNNQSFPNVSSVDELTQRANDDASNFISALKNDYLTFSILAVLTLIQNVY